MKLNNKWLMLALALTFSAVFLVPSVQATGIDGGYVGDAACAVCHTDYYTNYKKSGHTYKMRFTGGRTPVATVTNPETQVLDPLSALLTMPRTADLLNPNNNADARTLAADGSGNLDWSAVEYVMGGFGQKARWGVKDKSEANTATGFIWSSTVSSPTGAQFNMLAADPTLDTGNARSDWSTYGSATKGYHCAVCHNTNGTTSNTADTGCVTSLGSGRTQPWASTGRTVGSPGGYKSEWSLTGVQCEACHGKGSNPGSTGHADGSGAQGVLTLGGVEICAKCHIRAGNANYGSECGGDAAEAILKGGACIGANCSGTGMVGHHEQYNEMMGVKDSTTGNQFDGVHASLKCTTCHDPHKRVTKVTDAIAGALGISTAVGPDGKKANHKPEPGAIKKQCQDCHYGKETAKTPAMTTAHAGVTCVDCHMGEATQTATTASGAWGKKGDLKTHVFKINPAAGAVHYRNNAAGKAVAANAMPIEFSCGKCHDSALTESFSGTTSFANKTAASEYATGYHTAIANIDGGYVGSNVCGTCHTAKYDDFAQTGHPFKMRFTKGKAPYDDGACAPGYEPAEGPNAGKICDPLSALLTMPRTADLLNPNNNADARTLAADGSGNLDWSAVEYVVGGFGQKARWGVKDKSAANTATGFIWSSTVASPSGAQFNMLAADPALDPNSKRSDWSTYGSATKGYHCAVCHNTNGTTSNTADTGCVTSLGSGRTQPWASTGRTVGSPGGYKAEWSLTGVQCEECHGKGLNHASAAKASNIIVTSSKDACGKCHIRANNANFGTECGGDTDPSILTSGACIGAGCSGTGMIGHHEQYNEMVGLNDGVHRNLDCVTCHDPHKRTTRVTSAIAEALGISTAGGANLRPAPGAVADCTTCHAEVAGSTGTANSSKAVSKHNVVGVTCVDCHMAEATQTATTASGAWGKKGDLKTHVFKINPAASAVHYRTNAAGKAVAADAITTEFACGKCHDSTIFEGGYGKAPGQAFYGPHNKTDAELIATNYHNIFTDLVISYLSLSTTQTSPGSAISVTDSTKNRGSGTAGASTTAFYLSTNTTCGDGDTLLSLTRSVPSLAGGETSTGTTSVTIPGGTAVGTYYICAHADNGEVVAESSETNNTRVSVAISVVANNVDLVISSVSAPTSAKKGANITVSDATKNRLAGTAGESTTRVYLSANAVLDGGDVSLNSRPVPSLAGGATSTGSIVVTIPIGTVAGSYYLIWKADDGAAVAETDETNNTRSKAITIVN